MSIRRKIALCVDREACFEPSLIGLGDERLDSQDWLIVFTEGGEARASIAQDPSFSEAWIATCEDVEPINLAASLKEDRPDLRVGLVGADACGSLYSRAHNASIDEVMDLPTFAKRYASEKRLELQRRALVDASFAGGQGELVHEGVEKGVGKTKRIEASVACGRPAELPASPLPRLPQLAQSYGFVLPIVSGSGGAGKSSVSVTCAFLASRMGYRVLLVDCDLQFGDAAVLAGLPDAMTLDVALGHPERLDLELRKNLNPMVLAAPKRLEDSELIAERAVALIDELAGVFDLIVVNTGAAWADCHAALLERSSAALFLVDQRASSLRACRHALELCARCGIATGPFQFAVNRCRRGAPVSPADASCALQGALVHEIEEGGAAVEEYLGAGAVVELIDVENSFCESLERILAKLLPGAGLLSAEKPRAKSGRKSARKKGRHVGRSRRWGQ